MGFYRSNTKRVGALRACNLFNNHDLLVRCGGWSTFSIEYTTGALEFRGRRTTVYSPGEKGTIFLGKRAVSWPAALKWAQEKTGHTFVASPFGGAIPEHVLQRAETEAKAAAALKRKAGANVSTEG